MDSVEPAEADIRSFIVKIWLEELDPTTTQRRWHGHITEVPGGERRYIDDLGEIARFIAARLGLEKTARRQPDPGGDT